MVTVYKKNDIQMNDLQLSLNLQKQEEEALLNEMEVTGQAFEEMQEQNIRLLQQIREKDDAHFKLMSEVVPETLPTLAPTLVPTQTILTTSTIVPSGNTETTHIMLTTITTITTVSSL